MATIVIPSSCIFSHTHQGVGNIKGAEMEAPQIEARYNGGKSSTNEASMTFFETSSENNVRSWVYVGNNPNKNPYTFNMIGGGYAEGTIKLSLDKYSYVHIENNSIERYVDIQGRAWDYELKCEYSLDIITFSPYTSAEGSSSNIEKVESREDVEFNLPMSACTRDKNDLTLSTRLIIDETDIKNVGYTDDGFRLYQETRSVITRAKFYLVGTTVEKSDFTFVFGENFSSNPIKQSKSFTFPSNELITKNNETKGALEFVTDNWAKVESIYQNGKEVYVLKCSISEYYDTDGNLVISAETRNVSSTFEKYQIVEPYIHTAKGDVPLSTKSDGSPKKFEVIGVDFSYAGVFWQELTIQEYVE